MIHSYDIEAIGDKKIGMMMMKDEIVAKNIGVDDCSLITSTDSANVGRLNLIIRDARFMYNDFKILDVAGTVVYTHNSTFS